MLPSLPERFLTPEMRTGLYYAAMYLPAGVSTLLLPIWLDGRGIGEEEIGIISATPIFIMIVLNLFVGRIADRAKDWRSVIIAGSLVSAVVSLGFVFIDEFWGIRLFNTLVVIPIMAIEPVIDAAAIRMTRRRGTDFARVRIWGTFGYIAMTALAGWLFGWLLADSLAVNGWPGWFRLAGSLKKTRLLTRFNGCCWQLNVWLATCIIVISPAGSG